jgi:biotin carboxyl carrier protein
VEFEFLVNDVLHKISLEKKEGHYVFSDGKKTYEADIKSISPFQISILIDNISYRVYMAKDKENRYFFIDGQRFVVKEPSEEKEGFRKGEERTPEGTLLVKAPMPGKVIKISVTESEEVRKNQTLAIVEAMKMENEIKASVDGTIKEIHVSAGDLVDSEMPLIELEPS